jgi:CheY-like chemotaxis protein
MLVLAADDGPMNAAVISILLETDPRFQLLVVGSGAEVLQYVAQAPHLPDIILLDVLLPDATGPEVRRLVRRHPTGTHTCMSSAIRLAVITYSRVHKAPREVHGTPGDVPYP